MKINQCIMLFAVAVASTFARSESVADAIVAFSTTGPDCYSDGTVVLDYEAYALVWSKDGNFEGFTAAGEPIDENDKIVLVGPLAEGGRCPDVLFQIPAEEASSLASGQYAVYMLDTRVTGKDGKISPRGVDSNGKLKVLNGYGHVASKVRVDKNARVKVTSKDLEGGNVAGTHVERPKNVQQPKIKNFRVEGDKVYLTVENLPGVMRVRGGKDLKASDFTGAATETTGEGGHVILVAPKTSSSSGFYQVIRN